MKKFLLLHLFVTASLFQGAIIEKVCGVSYQQFIQTRIFDTGRMNLLRTLNADSNLRNKPTVYTKRKNKLVRFGLETILQSLDENGFGA